MSRISADVVDQETCYFLDSWETPLFGGCSGTNLSYLLMEKKSRFEDEQKSTPALGKTGRVYAESTMRGVGETIDCLLYNTR